MMWAVDVPAFMIQAPPCLGLSGRPVDCVVAPGTAIMAWCRLACAWEGPATLCHVDPYSGFTRVPSFSAALRISSDFFLSPAASAFRFWATRSRLAMLVHWTENGCCCGKPDRSYHTRRFEPFLSVAWVKSGFHLTTVAWSR